MRPNDDNKHFAFSKKEIHWDKEFPLTVEQGGFAGTLLTVGTQTPVFSVEFLSSLLPSSPPFSSLSLSQEMSISLRWVDEQ